MLNDYTPGLLSGTNKSTKRDHKIQVDGYKYYEVNIQGKPTFQLKSGPLGHVVVRLGPGSNEIALHSRLLQIDDRDCYSAKEADVKSALAEAQSPKLLFERPESFEIRYTERSFDFHFEYNEYGHQVTRIEEGGPARGTVPLGAIVTMVNGQSLIYSSAASLDELLMECSFPALITFEVFGQIVNERGQVIISASRDGIQTRGQDPNKSSAQPMAVISAPDVDSPLRENARKKKYPIIGICEWCSGFCTLLVGILLLSALVVDELMHVDTEWDDSHEQVEHMSLVIKSSEILGKSATTEGYVYEFEDSSLCSMPNNYFKTCMDAFDYGEIFESVCDAAKVWQGLNATSCTLALITAILIFGGKCSYRDTALLGFGWCVLVMAIGFMFTVIGSVIQMINAVEHMVNGEDNICHCMLHDLHYQTFGAVTSTFDSCNMGLSSSSILGSVAVAFWIPTLCILCTSWMNTPKTCFYVGDY